MRPAADGSHTTQCGERPQKPESQGRATSDKEQCYPARLVLAQGKGSLRPPPLAATKCTDSPEGKHLGRSSPARGGGQGWRSCVTPLGNIRRGDPLPVSEGRIFLPRPARGSTEVQREVCNTFTRGETTKRQTSTLSLQGQSREALHRRLRKSRLTCILQITFLGFLGHQMGSPISDQLKCLLHVMVSTIRRI